MRGCAGQALVWFYKIKLVTHVEENIPGNWQFDTSYDLSKMKKKDTSYEILDYAITVFMKLW